jgi:hypothetical protein
MGKNSEQFLQQQQEAAYNTAQIEQQLYVEKIQYTKGVDALSAQCEKNTSIINDSINCVDRMIDKVKAMQLKPDDASVLAILNPEALD